MSYLCDFECEGCEKQFTASWDFGDNVACSYCGAEHETDWDTNDGDDIFGPWIVKLVGEKGS